MHRRSGSFFSCSVFLLASWNAAPACAQELAPATREAVEGAMAAELAASGRVGVSVGIVRGGSIAYTGGLGFADLEHRVAASAATVYRLASISKTFTAVAALQLAERGALDLDADVRGHVPEFPQKRWPVTSRQLLGHLSGIRHYRMGEIWSTKHYDDLIAPLEMFRDDPLLYEPGSRFRYTTYGYNLLGAVVARAADTGFLDVLRRGIFEPAGMRVIRDDDVAAIVPHRARGYRKDRTGQVWNCVHVDTSNKIPGGGLVADVGDLCRYAIALLDGRLLSPPLRDLLWTEGRTREGRGTGYGLGWSVRRNGDRRQVHHTGGQPGTSTALLLLPEEGVAVVVLSNLEGAGTLPLAQRLAELVL